MAANSRNRLYIAGGPGGNSIGPKVHEFIARSLGLDWKCDFLRLESVDEVMKLFRAPEFAGGIVTMPHKRTVIPLLDQCDDLVTVLGACNFVHLSRDGELHGTNTDWIGIYDSIIEATPDHVPGKVGLVYGAGGASRAAIYALWEKLSCTQIYIVNRDEKEVMELIDDIHRQPEMYWPEVVHVRTVDDCRILPPPYYIVSTVPDFEPATPSEFQARNVLVELLSKGSELQGLMLDMCYHPPVTRNLTLASKHGYRTIKGFTVVANQFPCQWKFWTDRPIDKARVSEMTERLVWEREAASVATSGSQ